MGRRTISLAAYHGVLDDGTAADLEAVVEKRREMRSESRRRGVLDSVDDLDVVTY